MRVFTDGFAHYSDILRKWASYVTSSVVTISSGAGARRPGTSFLSIGTIVGAWAYVKSDVLTGLTDRGFVGAAVKAVDPSTSIALTLCSGATDQVTVKWDRATGKISVLRGGVTGTQLAITSNAVDGIANWNYLEFGSVISDTVGTVEVRLNGVPMAELTLTGQDTKPSSAAGVDSIKLQTYDGISYWTDVLVDNADFRGDIVIDTKFVTAAGAHADFTPNPAGNNYENVDEERADGDGSYNASNTQGHMDTFVAADLTSMPTSNILSVAVNLDLRKDDAATRQVKAVIRQGGTDHLHATAIAPSGTYKIYQRLFDASPDDGGAWAEADFNNAEFGYEQSLVS